MYFNININKMETYLIQESERIFNEIVTQIDKSIIYGELCLIIIIGMPGSGKTTLWNRIHAHYNNDVKIIGMSSADLYMPIIFDFNLLGECHRKCISDIFNCIESGHHAFVDNTGANSAFNTIYKYICDVMGAKMCKFIFSVDKWLDCEKVNTEFVDTLEKRCLNRHKLGGKKIDKQIITGAIERSRFDFKKEGGNLDTWLNTYPIPFYKKGFSKFEGYIYRSDVIDNIADDSISDSRIINRKKDILRKQIRNGIENHITVISNEELSDEIELYLEHMNLDSVEQPISRGIGKCVNSNGDDTIFVVIEWEWGDKLREQFGLSKKNFHITLMWSGEHNIYDEVTRDLESINW